MRIPPLGVPSARLEHVVTSRPPAPQDRFVPSAPLSDVARTLFAPVRPLWVHRPALEEGDRPGGAPVLPLGADVLAGTQRTRTLLDASSGTPRWTVRLEGNDRFCERPPLHLGEGRMAWAVAADHTGRTTGVAVIDTRDGRLLHTVRADSILALTAGRGGICFGTVDGEVVRIHDGAPEVLARSQGAISGLAVSPEGTVAYSNPGGSSVHLANGREVPVPGSVRTIRAVATGGFLALSGEPGGPGALTRLRADGRQEWQRQLPGDYRGLAVARDGSIFLLDVGKPAELLGLDAAGQARWRKPVGDDGVREWPDLHPLASGGVALVVPSTGLTVAFRPDGTEAWRLQDKAGHLSVTPDERLLATRQGGVRVVDLATGHVPLEFDPGTQRFTWSAGDLRHTVDAAGERLEVAGHATLLPGGELVLPGADGSVSLWRVPPPTRTVEARPVPTIEEGPGWIRIGDVLLPCA